MKVAELMMTDLVTIAADASVSEAVLMLADSHITGLPVLDTRGKFVGVITTADVLQAAAGCGDAAERERLFENTRVEEIMTRDPQTIELDDEVRFAARNMLYLDIHRLFVVDGEKLVGVISQSDLVRAVATSKI